MYYLFCFVFNDTATTEIYTYLHTLSLHDALPISPIFHVPPCSRQIRLARHWALGSVTRAGILWPLEASASVPAGGHCHRRCRPECAIGRSEEHTSELQSLMRISYAVFCLKKKKTDHTSRTEH